MTIKELRETLEQFEKEGYGECKAVLNIRTREGHYKARAYENIHLREFSGRSVLICGNE